MHTNNHKLPVEVCIELIGNMNRAAIACGTTRQAVGKWIATGRCAPAKALELRAAALLAADKQGLPLSLVPSLEALLEHSKDAAGAN